jgi:hypothetical protein
MAQTLVAGDNTELRRTLRKFSDSSIIDVTGATVKLYYSIDGGAVQTRTMTLLDAPNGRVKYKFALTDLIYGRFVGEIEITDSSGNIHTCDPKIEFNIVDRLKNAA